jgi:hypothetical protein
LVARTFADPVALEFGEGRHDGQKQPRDPVARHVVGAAVEVEQEQGHAARLERLHHGEAVCRGAEHAIQLRSGQGVALAQLRPEHRPLGSLVERHRAGDPRLDLHRVELRAALHGPALKLALLHRKGLAVLGLSLGYEAGVIPLQAVKSSPR